MNTVKLILCIRRAVVLGFISRITAEEIIGMLSLSCFNSQIFEGLTCRK
jgi:hypothetical protein